jgi:hypothetical protein
MHTMRNMRTMLLYLLYNVLFIPDQGHMDLGHPYILKNLKPS